MELDRSHIQYLHNNNGKPTAVLIPISDWKTIEEQMLSNEIPQWQKKILDERLELVRNHTGQLLDFDAAMDELENEAE